VEEVPEVEFGLTEELRVRFGGEESGDFEESISGSFLHGLENLLRFGFLFGSESRSFHGATQGGISYEPTANHQYKKNSTHF
jgi:hypothetical protein